MNFTHYGVKMLANTPVFAALFPCTALKFSFKKFFELKAPKNLDFSRRKGVAILTYGKTDNTEKADFSVL